MLQFDTHPPSSKKKAAAVQKLCADQGQILWKDLHVFDQTNQQSQTLQVYSCKTTNVLIGWMKLKTSREGKKRKDSKKKK